MTRPATATRSSASRFPLVNLIPRSGAARDQGQDGPTQGRARCRGHRTVLLHDLGRISPRLRAFANRIQASPRSFALKRLERPGSAGTRVDPGQPGDVGAFDKELAERARLRIAVVSVGGSPVLRVLLRSGDTRRRSGDGRWRRGRGGATRRPEWQTNQFFFVALEASQPPRGIPFAGLAAAASRKAAGPLAPRQTAKPVVRIRWRAHQQ